jgi:DMSO/TMAO reductase YedYZ molybdopterin-dependent catalytic subunit
MTSTKLTDRRRFLTGMLQAASLLVLAGCDNLTQSSWLPQLFSKTERLTCWAQRTLTSKNALANEYTEADLSKVFPVNGNSDPDTLLYTTLAQGNFVTWKLEIGGLVQRPAKFTLSDIHAMPFRTQITRHDCVEGWSAIGKWKGVPLREMMDQVKPLPSAKYVVFHCADIDDDQIPYYDSIALEDAYHPQTIMAYEMNDALLDIAHGAPLRLRLERQLGYKHAKYVMRIELAENLDRIGGGCGGYWEDQGYEWNAGFDVEQLVT